VLVDNFNNQSNLQGTGGTIVDYNPSTKQTTLFAKLPQNLPQCPGGVGLTTAMTMLKRLGDRRQHAEHRRHHPTKGDGCLLVFDSNGQLAALVRAAHQRSLGQHGGRRQRREGDVVRQHGGLRRAGPDRSIPATGLPVSIKKATVLRIQLRFPPASRRVTSQTVVASGFASAPTRTCS
jgi:hypothetical protein